MKRNATRPVRSREALLKGLESVLYEMVILATAVLFRDKRHCFQRYPGLQWGPPQIANDVIRLKARLLLDFFYSESSDQRDIIVSDFPLLQPLPSIDPDARQRLAKFQRKVNKWTVHLSWERTEEAVYDKHDRELMASGVTQNRPYVVTSKPANER
jgi:hypothetical protein